MDDKTSVVQARKVTSIRGMKDDDEVERMGKGKYRYTYLPK